MANARGSPDIVERGKATQFTRGGMAAVEAQKKSTQKRRENRAMRETMQLLANMTLGSGKAHDLKRIKSLDEVSSGEYNLTLNDMVALKIAQGALEDDQECRRLYLELTGALEKDGPEESDRVTVVIDV